MTSIQLADIHVPIAPEELAFWNRNFQFSTFLPEFSMYLERQAKDSTKYRLQRQQQDSAGIDQYYGTQARQFFRKYQKSSSQTRACIFVHGGYWRALSVDSHDFVGMSLAQEVDFYNVEYRLQPTIGFPDQINDVRKALALILQQCKSRGVAKVDLLGHSAGAHLAFCAIQGAEICDYLESGIEITLSCISGIYDLEPLSRSFLAKEISFSAVDLRQFSPINQQTPFANINYLICVGEDETPEYFRQAFSMLKKLNESGHQANFKQLPKANHMQAIQALLNDEIGPFGSKSCLPI